jgi:hypothetical protein
MAWKEIDLTIETQSRVCQQVRRTIIPFCVREDYRLTDEVRRDMAWERIRAHHAELAARSSANDPPSDRLAALKL